MWTKLLWIDFQKGIKPTKVGKVWESARISNRWKAKIQKEFRIHNVPWVFEPQRDIYANNPRNRLPKGTKRERTRPLRLAKIEKNLELAEKAELDYRINRLNNKKMTGLDLIIQKAMPSFLSGKAEKQTKGRPSGLVKLENNSSGFGKKK